MLGRLISWCVPDSALELRADEHEIADVERALAPYEHETQAVEPRLNLRIVGNQ
jgi:hypothetical protein